MEILAMQDRIDAQLEELARKLDNLKHDMNQKLSAMNRKLDAVATDIKHGVQDMVQAVGDEIDPPSRQEKFERKLGRMNSNFGHEVKRFMDSAENKVNHRTHQFEEHVGKHNKDHHNKHDQHNNSSPTNSPKKH